MATRRAAAQAAKTEDVAELRTLAARIAAGYAMASMPVDQIAEQSLAVAREIVARTSTRAVEAEEAEAVQTETAS